MRAARGRSGGFLRYVGIPRKPRHTLSTTRPVPTEIFSALSYLSEIPSVGKEFVAARNPHVADVELVYRRFRAFLRQARTFWDAAQPLHHRAGPLNYYYSFLNLAKAYICLAYPDPVAGRPHHGLSAGESPPAFNDAVI